MTARHHPRSDLVARVLAERLGGCEPSDQLRAMVGSRGTDWEHIIAHASDHLVLPALAAALRDLGLIACLDEQVGAFLAAIHAANAERNKELCAELAAAVAILNQADIEPVLLKGAIRLTDGLYPDDGWRMLRDIDLLVPEARWAEALGLFRQAGYALSAEINKEVTLRRDGALAQIDLHKELFSQWRQQRLLRAAEVLNGSRRAAFSDGAVRLPSMSHQVVHLLGQIQLKDHNHAYGRLAWRDWLEAAALDQWAPERIDWQAVFARFEAAGYRRALLTFLWPLQDYSLGAIPMPGRIGPLASLHRHRLRLQAESAILAQLSAWSVWSVWECRRQFEERDETGQLRIFRNIKRLMVEPGAASKFARGLIARAPRA